MEPSSVEDLAKFEETESLKQSLAKISRRLGPTDQRRVPGDIERRCLALVEMEISGILASLNSCPFPDMDMRKWLQQVADFARRILESTHPRWHTLPYQAVVYSRRRNPTSLLLHMAEEFLIEAEHPLRYMLHPLPMRPSCDTEQLPREEAGGVPLVGVDRPIKYLLRWLSPAKKNRLSVMSVVGPFGIGKTTLATELHNRLIKCQTDGRGSYCLNFNIMARVSKGHDTTELLLQEILSQISGPAARAHPRPTKIDLLVSCISELLQNKRYFICIDDITDAFEWELIKYAFPKNGLDSRILITSHFGSTAWACGSDSNVLVHEVKPLNRVDSKRLLITRAFGSMETVPPNSENLPIDKILKRCDGIPLLINGMADWLKEKIQLQWHQQYEEELDARVPKQLVSSLSSAYDDLPYYLKIPSLYVSMFPYGYKFDKRRLVSFFPDRYLSELVHRIIITRVAATCKSDPDEDETSQWHVNHYMHQFLAYKSAENSGFAFTKDYLDALPASKVPRRLALHNPNPMTPSQLLLGTTMDFFDTRSLAVSGADVREILFSKFVYLQQLDLEGWENLTDENLQQVCKSKMIFLQYLSIRNGTRVTKLPQEIKDLCSLKVLDISNTHISELPLEVFKLEFLHELDLRGTQISQLSKQIMWLQHSLSVLLLGKEGMLNSVKTTRVPHDILCLRKLNTLATIDLSEEPASFVDALGDIPSLRVLAMTWSFHQSTDEDYRDALKSSIEKLCNLVSLTIHCGLGCSVEFLGLLSKPPSTNLKKFKVTVGRFASIPKWISELRCLSTVQITVCKQRADDLNILGGLPMLQCLILGLDFIPLLEDVVIESEGFQQLRRFAVDCPNPWLTFRTGAMWKLTYLQLKFCAIPARENCVPSGIRCLQSLTEVALRYNVMYANSPSVKDTVAAVREQVANHLNPIDLFINGEQDYDGQASENEETETEDSAQPVDEEVVKSATTNQIQTITSEIEEVKSDA